MSSTQSSDAVIVAVLGDGGRVTTVWRYRNSEADLAERQIVMLARAGRQLRITFLDLVPDYALTAKDRARLERAVAKPHARPALTVVS